MATVVGGATIGALARAQPAAADVPAGSVVLASLAAEVKDPAPNLAGARSLGTGPNQAGSGATVGRLRARDVDPHEYGTVDAAGVGGGAAILAALAAAELAGGSGVVRLRPNQTYLIDGSLPLAGFSSTIVGAYPSAAMAAAPPALPTAKGSVLKAVDQSGPVLDLAGWKKPYGFYGKAEFGGFVVAGDGTAGAAKVGISLPSTSSVWFHDISIFGTGGAGIDATRLYLSELDRIVIGTPVGAYANDVPYLIARASNCNKFSRLGFRSVASSQDVGASGAFVLVPDAQYPSHDNLLDALWFEFLHPGEGSTLIDVAGHSNVIRDSQFVDCGSTKDGEGGPPLVNSFIRLRRGIAPQGGNEVSGVIPGGGDADSSIRYGVHLRQQYNAVVGVKGYPGNNVLLDDEVTEMPILTAWSQTAATVRLGGSLSAGGGAAVVMSGGGHVPPNVRVQDATQPENPLISSSAASYEVSPADVRGTIVRNNGSASTQLWRKPVDMRVRAGQSITTINRGAGVVTHQSVPGAGAGLLGQVSQAQWDRVVATALSDSHWMLTN